MPVNTQPARRCRSTSSTAARSASTVAARRDEAGIVAAGDHHRWPVAGYPPHRLATVDVPHPSAVTRAAVGTPSVAEAACLLPLDPDLAAPRPVLLLPKRTGHRATLAVARHPAPAPPPERTPGSGPRPRPRAAP
ncbi:cobalamin biosynthesis protein [Frankia sp. AiPs1]|uniref:cobalamin biosynthesis protein n=1 Tax=Frankia sp. AiPs1 TaxID=573493 RepID=UPI002044339B|nr:cobalamin biosynthesis protein [Frankia sp. AiPs1]MCM3922927.1 cobalamin biosynthesis protein [Frankia sp. AiPs1]